MRSQFDTPQEAILATVAAIPRGRVVSYGEVAARAGLPRRARLVGRVLSIMPAGSTLPWHRVLRADGHFAFPPHSRGFREQRRRLIDEGVEVIGGHVDLSRFGWERDFDAVLWDFRPPLYRQRVARRRADI